MTRKEQLIQLRDKVQDGAADFYHFSSAFPAKPHGGDGGLGGAINAYNGSLDAAQALHNALLPGISQYSIVADPTCVRFDVCWWPDGLSGGIEICGEGFDDNTPARAWLVAILNALIEQEP